MTSETSAALPFAILSQWDVGDCGYVEAEAHRRLEKYRVSHRREFFSAPVSTIVATIETVLAELRASGSE